MPSGEPTRVYLLAPGSGESGKALEASRAHSVHLAVGKAYDVAGRRYPPAWATMRGVALDEAKAAANGIESIQPGFGSASAQNLATWASKLYDPQARKLVGIDLSEISKRGAASSSGENNHGDGDGDDGEGVLERDAAEFMVAVDEASFRCLVCGSRGGQVTLPALWLLGCRLPAVVANGGCCRPEIADLWPSGVPLVLITGGLDSFNEQRLAPGLWDAESDAAYRAELWAAVPEANLPTTAILHLPHMGHAFDEPTLRAVLPLAVEYASSDAAGAAPAVDGLSLCAAGLPEGETCIIVTAEKPDGEVLCGSVAS